MPHPGDGYGRRTRRRTGITQCLKCPASITFLPTRKGTRMPVDASSLTADDIRTIREGGEVQYRKGEHVPHWSSCPEAHKFKRRAEEQQSKPRSKQSELLWGIDHE